MKPRSGFIISIFLLLLTTPFSTQAQDKNCRKVDVTVDITDSNDGQKGSIKVSAKDSDVTFLLHIMGKGKGNHKNDQFSITTGIIKDLPPGKYDLVIHYPEGNFCTETRTVTVN
jgi:hypothetical protein